MRQEPEGFAEFWDVWRPHMRHTDGRGDARERYRKELLKGSEPQDIIDGAKAFLRNWVTLPKDEQKYIPLAATWLHKESYADWCEKERAFQVRQTQQPRENVVSITPARTKSAWLEEFERKRAEQA